MMQINSIYVGRMNNGAHFRFMKNVLLNAQACSALMARGENIVNELAAAFAKEDELLKVSQKSFITDDIAAADQERDNLYLAFKKTVSGLLGMPVPAMAEAAKKLNQKLVDYNIDVRVQLDTQTALMENLIADLTGGLKDEVALLGLTPCVERMKELNDQIDRLLNQRDDERKYTVTGALKAQRAVTDEAYRKVVLITNALILMEGEEAYADYVAHVNSLIVRMKREVLGQGATSTGGDAPTTGTDDDGSTEPGTTPGTGDGGSTPGTGGNEEPDPTPGTGTGGTGTDDDDFV